MAELVARLIQKSQSLPTRRSSNFGEIQKLQKLRPDGGRTTRMRDRIRKRSKSRLNRFADVFTALRSRERSTGNHQAGFTSTHRLTQNAVVSVMVRMGVTCLRQVCRKALVSGAVLTSRGRTRVALFSGTDTDMQPRGHIAGSNNHAKQVGEN